MTCARTTIVVPIRTVTGLNAREHYMARARRVRKEREAVAWALAAARPPQPPIVVTLTRVTTASRLADDDNLQGAMKGCRDQIAAHFGLDDADPAITWHYAQRRGAAFAVEIDIQRRAQ